MPNSLSPRDLTQVAIQPVASPVSLNILPAPGAQLTGNSLQQLAQAMSSFSPALEGMLAKRVAEDKQYLAAQGSAVDFSQTDLKIDPEASLEERQAALNKAFKKTVEATGSPDSANPFFLVAARQNFGRAVGLQYRNALASLSDKATDPDNPVPFTDIAKEAAQMVGADAVTGDVYGATGFASVAQEANAEYSQRAALELRKKQDFLAFERTQNGVADALRTAAASGADFHAQGFGSTPVGTEMQKMIDGIKMTTTDPEKARQVVLGAMQTALDSAGDEVEAGNMVAAMAEMKFGKSSIRDNPAIFARLQTLKDQRINTIMEKDQRDLRLADLQVKRGMQEIYGMGLNEKVTAAVMNGQPEKAQQIVEATFDQYDTNHKDAPLRPDVRDAMRYQIQEHLSALTKSVGVQLNASNEASFAEGFDLIDDGTIKDMVVLSTWTKDRHLEPSQVAKLTDYFVNNAGIVRTAAANYAISQHEKIVGRIGQSMVAAGFAQIDSDGKSALPQYRRDEAQQMEDRWKSEANGRVQEYVRGDVVDPTSGLTYQKLKERDGVALANRSIINVLDRFYDEKVKALDVQYKAEKAANDAGVPNASADPMMMFATDRAAAQHSAVVTATTALEKASASVDDRNTVMVNSLGDYVKEMKGLMYDVGIGYGGAFDVDAYLVRLGEMNRIADRYGVSEVKKLHWWRPDSAVSYTREGIKQMYGYAKRSVGAGLSPSEIVNDQTAEGLPVFNCVLPRREDAVDFAFTVPMFQTPAQIRDPEAVNDVINALGIPANLRAKFILRQKTLLEMNMNLRLNRNPTDKLSPVK